MCAKFCNVLLAIQMLYCSIFGCCWHHVHNASNTTQTSSESEVAATCCCHSPAVSDCETHDSHGVANPIQSPNPCDEGHCIMQKDLTPLSAESVLKSLVHEELVVVAELITTECVSANSMDATIRNLRAENRLKRCAVLQVWLI